MPITSQWCSVKIYEHRVLIQLKFGLFWVDEEPLMKVHLNSCMHFPSENNSDSGLISAKPSTVAMHASYRLRFLSNLSSNGFESRFLGPGRDITHEEKLGEYIRNCVNMLFKLRNLH
jgi:hypothetical protein